MSTSRKSAILAAAVLVVAHVGMLAARYGTPLASLWGDWIGSIAGFVGALASWDASRRSGPFGKRVWRLVCFSVVLVSIGQAAYTYYFDYHHDLTGAFWPSDILVFFWAVPAMMTLFLSPRDPNSGFRWLRLCDFAQICTLVLALELSTLYVPSRWQISERTMAERVFYAGVAFFGLLALSFLLRGLLTRFRTARAFFLRMAAFFFAFAVTSNITLFAFASENFRPGAWPDLLWTLTDCFLIVIAATWDGAEGIPETGEPLSPGFQLLMQFSPLLIPAIVFPLVLGIAQEQFFWAVVLVTVSFLAASGRLFVVQNQLLQSSRRIAEKSIASARHHRGNHRFRLREGLARPLLDDQFRGGAAAGARSGRSDRQG